MEPNKETQNGFFEKLSIDNFLLGIVSSADFMFIENGLGKKLQKKLNGCKKCLPLTVHW